MTDDKRKIAWRNVVVQWHLDQTVPLECGCDDDTPDDRLCELSQEYATKMVPPVDGGGNADIDEPADKWDHDIWVAAWGRNAPLILSGADLFGMPKPPAGMAWLVTRVLVRGRKAVEVALLRLGGRDLATVARGRSLPTPESIAARAREFLQRLPEE